MLIEEELATVKGGQAIQKICLMRTVIGMLRRDADGANGQSFYPHLRSYKEAGHEENNGESGEGGNNEGDLERLGERGGDAH
jgi:hypothetical protein